jgi:neutral ceramidase
LRGERDLLKAGFAKVCITPSPGASLAGFAARKDACTGVHDDLFARALVIDNGALPVVVVSVDVLALAAGFVDDVRRAVTRRVPVEPGSVMIACTHTHAAPVTIRTFFNPDESVDQRYMDRLARAIEDAVADAWEHRAPGRIGAGSGHVTGIGVNRRTRTGRPVDEEIGIVKVADETGTTRGVLFNYACHPTVLGPDNLLATGDFPNMAVARIEGRLGPGSFAMYTNGAQGDISMGHSSELSAIGVIAPGRTFEHAAELGFRLGDAVWEALDRIETRDCVELAAATLPVKLPLKRYPHAADTARTLREAEDRVRSLEAEGDSPAHRQARSELLYSSGRPYRTRSQRSAAGHGDHRAAGWHACRIERACRTAQLHSEMKPDRSRPVPCHCGNIANSTAYYGVWR